MLTHNIDPVFLEIGALKIHYYGLLYAILFLCSYFIARWFLKKHNHSPDHADNLLLIAVIAVIVGARLGHVFFYNWEYFSQNLMEIFFIWKGGLASHGAVIGLFIAAFVMKKITKVKFWELADLIVLCSSLAVIFIRIGNFINGEIVGRVTDVNWGVVFPCNGLVKGLCGDVVRHPVQLYESFTGVIMAAVLYFLVKKYPNLKSGVLTGVFLIGYFGMRIVVEFFKEFDGDTILFAPLTNGQVLSIPLILGGAWILWKRLGKEGKKKPQK